ncbi:MAG: dihydrolipoyl dehydrogenase [Clostridiales Family XIII bacterium]|jgi:dihydrolipoamide dehydrogenase|nr:dihydrolipoyl dehydrogenase [Clostridiales Family XIII bacterium]
MIDVIVMPKLGFNMDEGKLVSWYKNEGEKIAKGEPLFSIETDKTSIDVEATRDGVVRKLFVEAGETIPVTLPIAILADAADDIASETEKAYALLGKGDGVPAAPVAAAPVSGASSASAAPAPASAAPVPAAASGGQPAKSGKDFDFDVIVIGGGPGGYVAAIKAAQSGKRTAIAEKENFGGVCLNRGCIPTKTLLRSVEALNAVKESAGFGVVGVDASGAGIDMKKVQERKGKVVKQLVVGVGALLKGNGVTALPGVGSILDPHRVKVGETSYSAEYIIIATGSAVKPLPVPADKGVELLTSDEALALTEIPDEITVIGGGVIGIEFAYFLAQAGAKVRVVEFLDRILPMVDEEITAQVTARLAGMGIEIHTGAKVTKITKDAVYFEKDGAEKKLAAQKVLVAVGRVPDTGGIDCAGLGIKTDRGAIVTDGALRTSVPNIFAVGDVNGKSMLAHTASMEGIVAVENICGHKKSMNYANIPSAVYIQPEIACVGLTEAQAREQHKQVKTGKFPLAANGKAKVAGEAAGLAKVIVDAEFGEILGVHLYCVHATDMIAEAVVAMNLESTAEEIAASVHPHPTVSEAVQEAVHAAIGKAVHFL